MRCAILLSFVSVLTLGAHAQQGKVPKWMLQATAFDTTGKLIRLSGDNHKAWVAEQHTNRFIGSYAGTIHLKRHDVQVDFTGWADSTRAFFRLEPHVKRELPRTQLADLKADVLLVGSGDSAGSVYVERLSTSVWKRPQVTAPWAVWGSRTELAERTLDRVCYRQGALSASDTAQFLLANGVPSPFGDLPVWISPDHYLMPYLLARLQGTTDMPLRYEDNDYLLEVRSLATGKQHCPTVDLHGLPMRPSPLAEVLSRTIDHRPRGDQGSVDGRSAGPGSGSGGGPGYSSSGDLPAFQLEGRRLVRTTRQHYAATKMGRVVLDITVDREGKVLNAMPARWSTTFDGDLVDIARKAAMNARFNADPKAPEQQRGSMTFLFELQ